jgi:DNA-binding IclR family transcriptional regulator
LVERAQDRGKHCLGFGVLRLASAVVGRQDVTQQGRLGCERLAAKLGETVNITCGARISAVSVEKACGPSAVDTHNRVGALSRLHATSSGQILLAYMRPEQRREVLGTCGLKRLTARTHHVARCAQYPSRKSRSGWVRPRGRRIRGGRQAICAPV